MKGPNGSDYLFYNGEDWVPSTSGKTVSVISPIDQTIVGMVQHVSSEEIDAIVKRAKNAQPAWEALPFTERGSMLEKAAVSLREQSDKLAQLLAVEIGKSYEESKMEVTRTADLIDVTVRLGQSITGEDIESDQFPGVGKGKTALVEHVAHGVVAAIAPFNYPINLAISKIAPALLMGNAVVFKPPTQGSIAGLYITDMFLQAGIPVNILSCITGEGRDVGNALVEHPDVRMIAFTGSTGVGRAIATKTGMKPLLFECGGNNATIVCDDADIALAAKEIVKGGFSYAGQRCTAIKYVIAKTDTLKQLVPSVQEEMKQQISMGDPRKPDTKLVGPVISEKAAIEVEQAISDAVKEGATLVCGGKREKGYVEPALLTHVTPSMHIVREEIFGPVVSFITVEHMDEAVKIINGSQYGLQTSVFTNDEGTGFMLARQLDVGTVQLNGSPQRGPDHFPFMGVKGSGTGVQGIKYSLLAMSRLKSVVMNKPQ